MLYVDLDGTLTGLPGGGLVMPDSPLVPPQHCTQSVPAFSGTSSSHNGIVCDSNTYFLRVAWNEAEVKTDHLFTNILYAAHAWLYAELAVPFLFTNIATQRLYIIVAITVFICFGKLFRSLAVLKSLNTKLHSGKESKNPLTLENNK